MKRSRGTSSPSTRGDASAAAAPRRLAGVILCGGSGTRMGRTRLHKVCQPIAGRPAIVRLIDVLRGDGVDPIVVVVGHRAGDVVETVGAAHPGIQFLYQRDRLGTGHAARIAVDALCGMGYDGPVVITMGDKWFEPGLVRGAWRRLEGAGADLLLVSAPKEDGSSLGRLVQLPRRGIVGVVELRDIQRARVLEDWLAMAGRRTRLSRAELRRVGLKRIRPARKLWRALGPLARFARGSGAVTATELAQAIREAGPSIRVAGRLLGPDRVEHISPTTNQALYVGYVGAIREALRQVGRDNAQDEYYLTDIVELIAVGSGDGATTERGRVIEHRMPEVDDVMAFNTRRELLRIAKRVEAREQPDAKRRAADRRLAPYLRTPEQWGPLLDPQSGVGRRLIERTYGARGPIVVERARALRAVVRLFGRSFGRQRRAFLVRAPGRVNLMGRHIDHQGGSVHVMALDREIQMAVAPRSDDVIRLVNENAVAFPPRELVLGDWHIVAAAHDWLTFVDGDAVKGHLASTVGDWSNYVLAAAVYQQHRHPTHRLRGMDVAVRGNVPMAAGLSSSSSLVVAAMEAVAAVNGIRATSAQIVEWCGQAEWFVGSRGGSADHAAIRLGRAGHVAKMGFFPFRILHYVPMPEGAAVLIAHSGEHAIKSAGARDRFNERVANYRLGMLLLRARRPDLSRRIEHLRDLSPSRQGVDAETVRAVLTSLPERITRAALRRRLPGSVQDLERIFASHADPGAYTIRDVVSFGVGECERSRIAAQRLERGDLAGFGELMRLSHDGDRVTAPLPDATQGPNRALHEMPGAYACSTRNIDRLVDIARGIPGVYGAQMAGAGLGGCVMVLAERRAARRVRTVLLREYYEPRGLEPAVWPVHAVNGGGVIRPSARAS
jgi:N-acetylgalactosamine kinase